jgi:hypothetical protein
MCKKALEIDLDVGFCPLEVVAFHDVDYDNNSSHFKRVMIKLSNVLYKHFCPN